MRALPRPESFGRRSNRRARGFTLMEMLTTVAIIGVMAALLMPALRGVLEKGKSAKCASNLRQIGGALLQYAADNDGTLPTLQTATSSYVNALTPYLPVTRWRYAGAEIYGDTTEGIYRCPEAKVFQWGGGYGVNETHMIKSSGGVKLTKIESPARLWLIGDACQTGLPKNPTWFAVRCPFEANWGSDHEPAPRHGQRVNITFADGHLESWLYQDLQANKNDIFGHNQLP